MGCILVRRTCCTGDPYFYWNRMVDKRMSDLLNNIESQLTGRKFPAHKKLDFVDLSASNRLVPSGSFPYLVETRLGVEYGYMATCKEEDIPEALRNFREMVRDSVYGDTYSLLLDLERAAYSEDFAGIFEAIQKMLVEIGYRDERN